MSIGDKNVQGRERDADRRRTEKIFWEIDSKADRLIGRQIFGRKAWTKKVPH